MVGLYSHLADHTELAKLMVRSGVGDLEVAITSGSQEVLNNLHMGFKLERLYDGCRYLAKPGSREGHLNYSLNSRRRLKTACFKASSPTRRSRRSWERSVSSLDVLSWNPTGIRTWNIDCWRKGTCLQGIIRSCSRRRAFANCCITRPPQQAHRESLPHGLATEEGSRDPRAWSGPFLKRPPPNPNRPSLIMPGCESHSWDSEQLGT